MLENDGHLKQGRRLELQLLTKRIIPLQGEAGADEGKARVCSYLCIDACEAVCMCGRARAGGGTRVDFYVRVRVRVTHMHSSE